MTAIASSFASYSLAAYLTAADLVDATAYTTSGSRTFGEEVSGRTYDNGQVWTGSAGSTYVVESDASVFLGPERAIDNLVAAVAAYANLGPSWDGEDAEKPSALSIRDATRFLRATIDEARLLEPTLHVDGSVMLEIEDGALGSLRFRGDGTIICAIKGHTPRTVGFDGFTVPSEIQEMLAV